MPRAKKRKIEPPLESISDKPKTKQVKTGVDLSKKLGLTKEEHQKALIKFECNRLTKKIKAQEIEKTELKQKLKDCQAKNVARFQELAKKLRDCKSNYESILSETTKKLKKFESNNEVIIQEEREQLQLAFNEEKAKFENQLQYFEKLDIENSELRTEIVQVNEINFTLKNNLNDQKSKFEIERENMMAKIERTHWEEASELKKVINDLSEKLYKENDIKKDYEKKCLQLSEANDKITLLKKVNANLTNKIAQSRESIDTLKLENSEIEKSKEILNDQKSKTEDEVHHLTSQLKELKHQYLELEISETKLSYDINLIKKEKEKLVQEKNQSNIVNAMLEAKVKQLDLQLQQKKDYITDLIKTKLEAEKNLISIREINSDLETFLDTSAKRVETLEESIKKLQEEKSQELEKVKEAEASKKSIIEENSQLKTSIETMKDKIQSQESDIKKLEDAKTNLENVLNSTEMKNIQLGLSTNALENKLRQSNSNLESMKRARDDYFKDKEELSKEVGKLNEDVRKAQAEIKVNEKNHQILIEQFKKTSKDNLLKYGMVDDKNKKLEAEIAQAKQKCDQAEKSYQELLDLYNEKVETENSEADRKANEMKKLKTENDGLKAEKQEIKNQMDKLNLELQNQKNNRVTEDKDHDTMERIKDLRVDNLVLRYNIKHQADNTDFHMESLKVSIARCLLDTLDDVGSTVLNDAQLDYVFKNIFQTKSKDCSSGSVSFHTPTKLLKSIICQAKSQLGNGQS